MTQKLIERCLPLAALSREAAREKSVRHGHISTVHVWWARRPLVVARAAVLASLLDADGVDEGRFSEFVADLCRWQVHDGDLAGRSLLERAREMIRRSWPDGLPKVLDPFAGGGSIPLEALRLGCDSYALDCNPVAYLLLKAATQYPQKYGASLVRDVSNWWAWIMEHAREELAEYYPLGPSGEAVFGYIWCNTITCQNSECRAEVPLLVDFWLARRPGRKIALYPQVDCGSKAVDFQILSGDALERAMADGFDPAAGTVHRANARCLVCGTGIPSRHVREEAKGGRMRPRLIALVTANPGRGRGYHLPRPEDLEAVHRAAERLEELKRTPSPWSYGLSWVPDEIIAPASGNNFTNYDGYVWGIRSWGDLFGPRQALALATIGKWVREAARRLNTGRVGAVRDPEYAQAVATYLALALDFLANNGLCILTGWRVGSESLRSAFSGHHLHMVWNYFELNPVSAQGPDGLVVGALWLLKYLKREASIGGCCSVQLGSATSLPFEDASFDVVVTDPPYCDNVPYADLSDFFFVWLRRSVGDVHPEVLHTPLTPKEDEAVAVPPRFGRGTAAKRAAAEHYGRLLIAAFREVGRVLKANGTAVVMYAHRTGEAWRVLWDALSGAGLAVTACWPVHTELAASTHLQAKAGLHTSALVVCRRGAVRGDVPAEEG